MKNPLIDILEILLTAEVYNRHEELDVNDLPKPIRKRFWKKEYKSVPKPISVSVDDIKFLLGIENVVKEVKSLPFIEVDKAGFRLKITSLELASSWFNKHDESKEKIDTNPSLAFYYEQLKEDGVDYISAKEKVKPKEVDREWVDSLISEIEEEEGGKDMLKLVRIIAPEDIMQPLSDLILTKNQEEKIEKIVRAIKHREYLRQIGLYDIGKLLMVGPPGTGKTSVARALSERLDIPFVEVRLSMITDQYLGETAKNIDRVFELVKKLAPCILFIDEFDFIAKTRVSDEHAALKRAVNTLLKAIDEISLTRDGVLLIAATNHPRMLDSAAWRRFDEIMNFPQPDASMRRLILDIVTRDIEGEFDTAEISNVTEGYTGSDLRMVIREAVLSSLVDNRKYLTQDDLVEAVDNFNERALIKSSDNSF